MDAICGGSKRGAQKFVVFSFINELYQNRRLELGITAAYKRQQGSQIK